MHALLLSPLRILHWFARTVPQKKLLWVLIWTLFNFELFERPNAYFFASIVTKIKFLVVLFAENALKSVNISDGFFGYNYW